MGYVYNLVVRKQCTNVHIYELRAYYLPTSIATLVESRRPMLLLHNYAQGTVSRMVTLGSQLRN
jgi:hypothetical protein